MTSDDEAYFAHVPSSGTMQGHSVPDMLQDLLRTFDPLSIPPPTMGHSMQEDDAWSLGNPYAHAYRVCCGSAILSTDSFTHTNQQVQCDLPLWISDPLSTLQRPNTVCRQQPSSVINAGVRDPGLYHAEPNNSRPLLPSHVPRASSLNDQSITAPYTSARLLSHPSPGPSSALSLPHQSPTEPLGSAPRFCVITPRQSRHSTTLSRRGQGARAIHYGGIWLDEQELLTALEEPNGSLHVFRCCWQEYLSPCHLWIRGEKSSINAHMQKWHGDRPGGDKCEVECCWSDCKTKMLKESIARHVVRMHLGEVWVCRGCQGKSTRYDVHKRHTATSKLEACRTSGALTTYSVGVVVVDARAALEGGGRVRYADA